MDSHDHDEEMRIYDPKSFSKEVCDGLVCVCV